MWILLKMYPYIDKHLWNLLVKFQLDPTIGFEVMLNSVKLNGRKVYAKIWIWPCLVRITRLNRIKRSRSFIGMKQSGSSLQKKRSGEGHKAVAIDNIFLDFFLSLTWEHQQPFIRYKRDEPIEKGVIQDSCIRPFLVRWSSHFIPGTSKPRV